jgi:hypothetical protein
VPGFLLEGTASQAQANTQKCAVCHTQERCTSCHVNVADVPADRGDAGRAAGLGAAAYAVQYPVPPSHLSPQWIEQHGPFRVAAAVRGVPHAEDCTACHVQPVPPDVIESFPARAQVQAPGTGHTERQMPLSHASRWFDRQHAALAASQPEVVQRVPHAHVLHGLPRRAGEARRTTRATSRAAFVAAYSRRLECSTCHEVRTFCRSCHMQQGMEAEGRLNPGFHDAEPLWLLRHARAARQGLESCTSCHTQRDCMQCHSQVGAFQVSPHGPNFDAHRRAHSSAQPGDLLRRAT